MTAIPSLVIGIASSAAERRQLAQLLGGTETFLIVSSAHQARRFLDLVRRPAVARGPLTPANAPETPAAAVPLDAVPVDAVPLDAATAPAGDVPRDAATTPAGVAPGGADSAYPGGGEPARDGGAPIALPALGLAVDSDRRVLRWRGREVGLTPLEHDLLVCLAGTPGQVWTYARLHRTVWGNEHLGRGSDMHSVVRRIRHKLGRLDAAATIHAVRGVGFRLTPS
ncbi:winged helix-turn-helix domain-containing protein [Micromonospora sp. NPDC050980]|uniref:winged helix-turn-helix domain-containing protein n=1 Tax=Micromonospora sp. NPDC050980 TaxID=3155161 RepID=UPI0034084467